jgi:hypothetical protein
LQTLQLRQPIRAGPYTGLQSESYAAVHRGMTEQEGFFQETARESGGTIASD